MAVNSKKPIKGVAFAVPFCILFLSAFSQSPHSHIIWKNKKAIGISFLGDREDGDWQKITVTLKGKTTSILGKFTNEKHEFSFYPVVPFTYGLEYQVKLEERVLYDFHIPVPEHVSSPRVLGIYPSSTTIPANLLKIHVRFSQPMQEGQSMKYICLIDEHGDTIRDVFLDLQPELWNEDHTRLTLWLDPGRIKRDLQPNLEMGPPLVAGFDYRVVVSKSWRDQYGLDLTGDFVKSYHAVEEDRKSPDVDQWEIKYPKVNSKEPLVINFKETIDYELALNAFFVDKGNQSIKGHIILNDSESEWNFLPEKSWISGQYEIIVETRLEDLAGNNLNRLFDRDLTKSLDLESEREFYNISFNIAGEATQ